VDRNGHHVPSTHPVSKGICRINLSCVSRHQRARIHADYQRIKTTELEKRLPSGIKTRTRPVSLVIPGFPPPEPHDTLTPAASQDTASEHVYAPPHVLP